MTWYGGVLAAAVVAFPLMYRTARGAFESFDDTLAYSGQTLGLSNTYIFWRIRMPYCRQGILAGTVLAFARALGEYGATSMLIGYTPAAPPPYPPRFTSCGGRMTRRGLLLGYGEPRHIRRGAAHSQHAGAQNQGRQSMSLIVDIKKRLGSFSLSAQLEAGMESRAYWAPPAAARA